MHDIGNYHDAQTIKAAQHRLARFEAKKVYSYEGYRHVRRVGVVKIGA